MNFILPGYYICKRTWKKLYYRPIHFIFSFIQPVFWLTIFGFLFEDKFSFSEGNYMDYLLPGVCAMTVLQTSAQSGILFIKDFQSQFFGRYNFTGISKTSLLFFKIFADYSRVVLQVFVLVGIGYLMGVETIFIDVVGFLKVILSTFMFTYFYASLSSFIAIKTKVSELMATFIHLFNLPIIFTSTALVPNKNLPNWIEQIAKYNPLSHLSNIIRESIIVSNFDNGNTTFSYLLLGGLMIISFFCITHYFKTINYD